MRVEAAHLQHEVLGGAVDPAAVVACRLDVVEHVLDMRVEQRVVGRVEDHVEVADGRLEPHDLGVAAATKANGRTAWQRRERACKRRGIETPGESAGASSMFRNEAGVRGESPRPFSLIDRSKCVKKCVVRQHGTAGRDGRRSGRRRRPVIRIVRTIGESRAATALKWLAPDRRAQHLEKGPHPGGMGRPGGGGDQVAVDADVVERRRGLVPNAAADRARASRPGRPGSGGPPRRRPRSESAGRGRSAAIGLFGVGEARTMSSTRSSSRKYSGARPPGITRAS